MDHNPYSPPKTNTETSTPPEDVSRPVAVWLLIALLLVFVLIFITTTVQFVGAVSSHLGEASVGAVLAATLAWRLALIVIFLTAAVSAYRRRSWSRWLGVALIVTLGIVMIFGTDTTNYANSAERAGGHMARFLVPLLLAWWAYVLAFSSNSKRYFSSAAASAD